MYEYACASSIQTGSCYEDWLVTYKICLRLLYELILHGIFVKSWGSNFHEFLIHEVLYAWCLKCNICGTWCLDIRISTCFQSILYISNNKKHSNNSFINFLVLQYSYLHMSLHLLVVHNQNNRNSYMNPPTPNTYVNNCDHPSCILLYLK